MIHIKKCELTVLQDKQISVKNKIDYFKGDNIFKIIPYQEI